MKQIAFTAPERAELAEVAKTDAELKAHEVQGRTLTSLVSPGTELNWSRTTDIFPFYPGYASVYQVDQVGDEVSHRRLGDRILCTGPHRDWQRGEASEVLVLPDGLAAKDAVFARLAGVSMATLATTSARPPSQVLVTGLGPVGNLAAQIFQKCGYQVTAVDPVEIRRQLALSHGILDVRPSTETLLGAETDFALHLECSGLQQPVLAGCQLVAKGGEVVLVGVPWKRQGDQSAFDLLHAVFHRYVRVRSGWEWEIPDAAKGKATTSHCENYAAAMHWINDGSLVVEGLASVADPRQAEQAYRSLADGSATAPTVVFDWSLLGDSKA